MGVYNDQGDASTPTGWTEITGSPFGTGTVKLCVFTRVMWSGTTAPTTTISGSGTNIAHVAAIATYNNVDTVNIIDVIGTSSTGTGSPMTCGGVTTNYDSSWVVVFAGRGDNEDVNTQTINASATGVTERTDAGTNEGNDAMLDATYFGTMLVQSGRVDGMVSGAAHTTAHTVRPAFEIIRTKPGVSTVSSIFLMCLSDRVLGTAGGQILFVRDGVRRAAHLPGNIILLSRHLVEDQDGPDAAAGFALAEKLRAESADPLVPILRHAGLLATVRLLTSGVLPEGSLAGYAETALPAEPLPLPVPLLLERFRAAGIASSPYAFALDPSGETVLDLIEGDPFRSGAPPPILPDGEWISLQTICQDG
jgi:hypothetical protein